jgi:hypothetical protein
MSEKESMRQRFKESNKELREATRFALNPDWNYRGDNTKYKEKK